MNIQLSISLLISDRADSLKKCLDSLKGILRELPCELIAVFTGKKEETLEIIKQYTDHIVPFEWCNDFSAARNAGLKEAKGEWFMFIDDDEWFENTDEIIRFFQTGEYKNYRSATYIVRNYQDWSGNQYGDAALQRLVKRTDDLLFMSSIHEYFQKREGMHPVKYMHDFAHHYGYVSKKKGEGSGKAERNIPLLLEELERNPNDGKNYMQLAQEYRNIEEYQKAEECIQKGLDILRRRDTISNLEFWLMVQLPLMIYYRGDKERALTQAEHLSKDSRAGELVKLELYKTIAQIATELHQDKKTLKAVGQFHELMKFMEKHPEKCDAQSSGGIDFSELKCKAHRVYVNGLISSARIKDYKTMRCILKMIPWDNEYEITDYYYDAIEQWKNSNKELLEKILENFSYIHSSNPYVLYQKMLYEEQQKNVEGVAELYEQCCDSKNVYIQKGILQTAIRNGFEIYSLISQMTLERWNVLAAELLAELSLEDEDILAEMEHALTSFPLYEAVLAQQLKMKYIQEKVLEGDELVAALTEFCRITLKYSRSVYHEQMFERENLHALPNITQFAVRIQEVLDEIEKRDYQMAIGILRETLEIVPQLRMIIKHVLDYVVKKSENLITEGNQEFQTLGLQIKQSVREMLERKEYQSAEPIIQQLCVLLPDDLEILRMKQQTLRKLNE